MRCPWCGEESGVDPEWSFVAVDDPIECRSCQGDLYLETDIDSAGNPVFWLERVGARD